MNTHTQLAEIAKSLGIKRFVHVSALGADADSPVRWLSTKAKVTNKTSTHTHFHTHTHTHLHTSTDTHTFSLSLTHTHT